MSTNINTDNGTTTPFLISPASGKKANPVHQAASGYVLLLQAMLNNFNAIQNYVYNGVAKMSEAENTLAMTFSNDWLGYLTNSDLYNIYQDVQGTPDPNKLSRDTSQFNLDNGKSNQSTTFFQGITSGLSDDTSKNNDAASNDISLLSNSALASQTNVLASLHV